MEWRTGLEIIILVLMLAGYEVSSSSHNPLLPHARHARDTSRSSSAGGDSDKGGNWRLDRMEDLSLTSDDKATFRCKIVDYDRFPVANFTFQWYKDNKLLGEDDYRIVAKRKSWGSQLRISGTYSTDSASYRCEATDGSRRSEVTASLHVSFHGIPESAKKKAIDHKRLQGKCEMYKGGLCDEYFAGKYVYVDAFSSQQEMERNVQDAMPFIGRAQLSKKCRETAKKAFCYFLFSTCNHEVEPAVERPLCREDCELLKYDICRDEFRNAQAGGDMKEAFENTNCSVLPPTVTSSTSSEQCSQIGIARAVVGSHRCYNQTGEDYKGTLSIGSTGESCQVWPDDMVTEHSSLAGGHNFCRNPSGVKEAPWCYVDTKTSRVEICQVPKCDGGNSDLVLIIIPAVSVPLLLGCLLLVFCTVCRKGNNSREKQPTKGVPLVSKPAATKKMSVPELMPNNVRVLQELGEGKLGKVFKAQMMGNFHYYSHEPVTVKTLKIGSEADLENEFHKEIEMFSVLQHVNVASLKAVVLQPTLRCMIFEYTGNVDLHEYLVMHSPQTDFPKPAMVSSNMSQTSSSLDPNDCIRMMTQISAGMEYLASKNFVHRDLAARNVLVCSNMELKISNLGLIQDSYLSCYYRSPQGGQMLPIRWMAPESLQSWQFSDKSAVWSYGVLLWEMFSYGMQPYCGYSNHEVLEMIGRRQLLDCPDQCPAKVYSLMIECWCGQPMQRPNFKDIHSKLNGWDAGGVTRMTSQLAHGIHRQLDQMKREDQGLKVGPQQQHQQQHQPLGIVDDRYVKSPEKGYYPPPPPPNNMYMQQQDTGSAVDSSNVYVNLPHNSHDASTASYHTRPPAYITQQQQQMMMIMGDPNKAHNQQQQQHYNQQQQQQQQMAHRPQQSHSSVYSRSDGSVQSNSLVNNKHATLTSSEESSLKAAINHNQYNNPATTGSSSNNNNGFPPVPPPMSVYENISRGDDAGRPIPSPLSPGLNRNNRHPPPEMIDSYPTIDRSYKEEQPATAVEQSRGTSERVRAPATTTTQAANNGGGGGGAKAPSCDSGLPGEEAEFGSDGADSARPLLQNNISVVAANAPGHAPIV